MTTLVRYQAADGPRMAAVEGGDVIDLAAADGVPARTLADLIGSAFVPLTGTPAGALNEVELLAPHPQPPRNVLCVGKNYREHAAEFAASGFDRSANANDDQLPLIVFTKPWTSIVGPNTPIQFDPEVTTSVDYEAELAVIIGTGGRNIPLESALDHVFGYTVVNDVTARDLQAEHRQWYIGKALDTFCPMGPVVVTRDALDISDLRVRSYVNGELRQDATTADLIYDVPTIISRLSTTQTLQPGDVIATGTPAGVGIGFDPPRFLADGDIVSVEVEGIGELANRVSHTAPAPAI